MKMNKLEMTIPAFGEIVLSPLVKSEENRQIISSILLDENIYKTLSICKDGEKPTDEMLDIFYNIFIK